MEEPVILCLAALPPPHHGVSIANDLLLNNPDIRRKYDIRIIPLSKPQLELGGRLALSPLAMDLGVTFHLIRNLVKLKPALTYLGLSFNRLGLYRDFCWIWLTTLLGSNCLIHTHGGVYRDFYENHLTAWEKKFYKLTLSRVQGIIVLDPSLAYQFQGLVANSRIFVLRNGIPDFLADLNFPQVLESRSLQAEVRVSYLSNLIPGKGYDTFLETAAELKNQGEARGFIFHLAGAPCSPQVAAQVEDFIRRHGLEHMVQVHGKVLGPEKWRFLLESDIFVFPSYLIEGQPFAIIEALAAGLPVISTPQGAIPAMVQDGVNGFPVPECDPTAIAQRLKILRDNVPLRLSMSRASRERYLEHHTGEKFVRGFEDICETILRRN